MRWFALCCALFAVQAVGCGGRVQLDETVGDGPPDAGLLADGAAESDGHGGPPPCTNATNFATDPNHCGKCGHGCLGGECVGGMCQPFEICSATYPSHLVVDNANLYWRLYVEVPATVHSCPKAGGVTTTIAQEEYVEDVAARNGIAYWTGTNSNPDAPSRIYRTPASGGTSEIVWSGSGLLSDIALDDAAAYVEYFPAGSKVSSILRIPLDSPIPLVLVAGLDKGVSDIALDDGNVYWSGGLSPQQIAPLVQSVPKIGGPSKVLVSDLGESIGLAYHGGYIYFILGDGGPAGAVGRVSVQSTVVDYISSTNDAYQYPQAVAADESGVYWAIGSLPCQAIHRWSPEAGVLVLHDDGCTFSPQKAWWEEIFKCLAVDSEAIYFCGEHSIYKLAK